NFKKDQVTLHKHVAEVFGHRESTVERLNFHYIAFSDELKKPELLKLVKINKEKVPFSCVNIAEQYEYKVNFTPPYHDCELQSIE
ncbi:20829_t:CDS:2, partial [Rhizophagus irregularis]